MSTTRSRHRFAWLAVVLVAVALAQTLGAMHRVVHAPGAIAAGSLVGQALREPAAPTGVVRADTSALGAFFAGHDSEHACEQFDQLTHADLVTNGHASVGFAAVACEPPRGHAGWQLAAQAAGFLARGPPAAV